MPKPSSKLSKTSKESLAAEFNRKLDAERKVYAYLQAKRMFAIDPNKGSVRKLARYPMGLTATVVLGKPSTIFKSKDPAVTHRTRTMISNAPCPGFVYLKTVLAANVCVMVGEEEDAHNYCPEARVKVDYPTIYPHHKYAMSGRYTGLVPPGYKKGENFTFSLSLIGPSSLVSEEMLQASTPFEDPPIVVPFPKKVVATKRKKTPAPNPSKSPKKPRP